MKWCKGCKNDFYLQTGCGLKNELRTAAVDRPGLMAQKAEVMFPKVLST